MAAAAVDSMGTQFADPSFAGMEEEVEYNCQGCGLVLEEGKAFELAGLRWHIECFKCNTCGTLLDSDANLLLLGDGSLICNNCTYSCSACGNKIEDLAILTGEQAYCAGCFKCRNCKRKIENLRYARTSQGMFCMDCHDALMARRRKKHRNAQKQRQAGNTDKSLPSLPPTVVLPESHFSPDLDSTPSQSYNGTPPVQQGTASELDSGSASIPPSRYNLNGSSKRTEEDYIPMSLDPNVAATSPAYQELPAGRSSDRGYFDRRQHPLRKSSKEPPSNENSRPDTPNSYRGESPHPGKLSKLDGRAQQEPHRPSISTQSTRTLSNIDSSATSESAWMAKTLERIDTSELPTPTSAYSPGLPRSSDAGLSPLQKDPRRQPSIQMAELDSTPISSPVDSQTPGLAIGDPSSISSSSRGLQRDNSTTLAPLQLVPTNSSQTQTIHRKEVPGSIKSSTEPSSAVSTSSKKSELSNFPLPPSAKTPYETPTLHHRTPSTSYEQLPPTNANGGLLISKPMESPLSKSFLDIGSSGGEDSNAGFTSPRAPPEVPKGGKHKAQSSSVGTIRSDFMGLPGSPTLSKFPKGSGTPDDLGSEGGFLRRMSNSVRHSRSHSDRGGRSSGNHSKLGKNLAPPLPESPSVTSLPEQTAEIAWLRQELQMERAKITERDARISELEGAAENRSNIRRMNTELREKRSTMVVLDTQKEIVFRELEALTQQMMSAKASPANMDLNRVSTTILREFGESLQRLRDSFAPQIEDLMEKKNDLSDELLKLAANKEKALEEFERLSIRNSQLMESNHSLAGSLNDLNRTSTTPTPQQSAVQIPPQIPEISRLRPTGLGIQQQPPPPPIQHQEHFVTNLAPEPRPSITESNFTGTTLTPSAHAEAEVNDAFLVQPQVVNIRKGQPKKTFNWKKGVQGVKGLKAAFSSSEYNNIREQTPSTPGGLVETIPYGSTTAAETPTTINPGTHKAMLSSSDAQKRGFNLFDSSQKGKTATGRVTPNGPSMGNADPSVLFGTELEARVRYEGVAIPLIITACVQEVEMRGMDIEGIYRKSGGTGSIEIIKDSFERNTDIDISNPDLDINAVTSTLKQYFRKLPTPLITYSVYDQLLATETVPSIDGRIQAIRAAIADLPRSHLDVLEFLIFHLHKVSQSEKVNLMTPMNCAVVFAPTIMRPESITREMTDTNTKNSVVQFMIEHVSDVFNKN